MSTFVICSVLVATQLCGGVSKEVDLKGRVIAENDSKYVVDFSAVTRQYKGDYSQRLVYKYECVKLNE